MKTTPIPVKFDRQDHSCNFYGGFGPTAIGTWGGLPWIDLVYCWCGLVFCDLELICHGLVCNWPGVALVLFDPDLTWPGLVLVWSCPGKGCFDVLLDCSGMYWSGPCLAWPGLVWSCTGLAWFGLVLALLCSWTGLVWFGLALTWPSLGWPGLACFDLLLDWPGLVWSGADLAWSGMVLA